MRDFVLKEKESITLQNNQKMGTKNLLRVLSFCFLFLFALGLFTLLSGCGGGDEFSLDPESGLFGVSCAGNEIDTTAYYVSPSGNDSASGIKVEEAFATIAQAFSVVRPGGAIRILPGIYRESIGLNSCGSVASPITVEGFNGRPVLDGEQKKTMAIFCENCDNYIFRNLEIRNFTDLGIAASQSKNIVLTDLKVHGNGHKVQLRSYEFEGYGIHVENSENVEIANNEVYENGPNPQIFPDYLMGTGINTFANHQVRIHDNRCYQNTGGGILVEDSFDVLVETNEVFDNDLDASADGWWDGGVWVDGGGDVTLRDNFFHDNLGPGIEISDEDSQDPKGYILENNRSINNYFGIFIWNFGTNDWPDPTIIKKSGNEFSGNSRMDVWIVDVF